MVVMMMVMVIVMVKVMMVIGDGSDGDGDGGDVMVVVSVMLVPLNCSAVEEQYSVEPLLTGHLKYKNTLISRMQCLSPKCHILCKFDP